MKRVISLLAGAGAILGSYLLVIFGISPAESLNSGTAGTIAFPALVTGLVATWLIATETRRLRGASSQVRELQAQLARKEVELTRLATHDDLTGLYSRHHFDATVGLEFERAKRHGRPFAVLLAEVDGLDEFSERAGSLSRGYLLSEVAALLRTGLRINDTGCRYADGCLAVLLPETDLQGAAVVADRIESQLAQREFFGRGQASGSKLTVSQGVAAFPAPGIESHRDLQRAAESALADAKTGGGARFCLNQPAKSSPPLRLAS